MLRASVLLLVLTMSVPVTAAFAQPAQIGNRANGFEYQPSQGEVTRKERDAGIAPTAQQQNQTDRTLGDIDRQLLGRAAPQSPPPTP